MESIKYKFFSKIEIVPCFFFLSFFLSFLLLSLIYLSINSVSDKSYHFSIINGIDQKSFNGSSMEHFMETTIVSIFIYSQYWVFFIFYNIFFYICLLSFVFCVFFIVHLFNVEQCLLQSNRLHFSTRQNPWRTFAFLLLSFCRPPLIQLKPLKILPSSHYLEEYTHTNTSNCKILSSYLNDPHFAFWGLFQAIIIIPLLCISPHLTELHDSWKTVVTCLPLSLCITANRFSARRGCALLAGSALLGSLSAQLLSARETNKPPYATLLGQFCSNRVRPLSVSSGDTFLTYIPASIRFLRTHLINQSAAERIDYEAGRWTWLWFVTVIRINLLTRRRWQWQWQWPQESEHCHPGLPHRRWRRQR